MDDMQTLLRSYLDAMSDPTRANLLLELNAAGELTATQMARRLGLSVNNVYHHIRVLNRLGVLDVPRIVPGPTYVEKYYRILPAIATSDPGWYDAASQGLPAGERQARWAAFCAQTGQLLLRAAERYAAMSPEDWEMTVLAEQSGMISLRLMPPERYRADLAQLRDLVSQPSASGDDCQQVMIIAALPDLMRIGPAGDVQAGGAAASEPTAKKRQATGQRRTSARK